MHLVLIACELSSSDARRNGCFLLTAICETRFSGISVRESIRTAPSLKSRCTRQQKERSTDRSLVNVKYSRTCTDFKSVRGAFSDVRHWRAPRPEGSFK